MKTLKQKILDLLDVYYPENEDIRIIQRDLMRRGKIDNRKIIEMFFIIIKEIDNLSDKLDKRYKKNKEVLEQKEQKEPPKEEQIKIENLGESQRVVRLDANKLLEQLLKENNLKLDFDVLQGTIATQHGIIKLTEKTLVIKASYVTNK